MKTLVCTLCNFLVSLPLFANTITALSSDNSPGDWDQATTWSGGQVPESGDIVIIPSNKGVLVRGTEYGIPVPTLIIQVWGTLNFEPSGKLDLSLTSQLILFLGGKIVPKNASSSQLITIGGVTKYNAANNGTVNGPAIANSLSGVSVPGQPLSGFGFGTALKVSFKNFLAQGTATGIVLKWETAQESGVIRFELERSEDGGNNWRQIAAVLAKGSPSDYTFFDSRRLTDGVLFRIKTIYGDNGFDYSSIIKLSGNAGSHSFFGPNPAYDFINIVLPANLKGKTVIGITNLAGQVARRVKLEGAHDRFQFNIQGLSKGIYICYIENNGVIVDRMSITVQ